LIFTSSPNFSLIITSSTDPVLLDFHLIPHPPSPKREGGKIIIFNVLAPLLLERGGGEVIIKMRCGGEVIIKKRGGVR
jgi:hypothetical protein